MARVTVEDCVKQIPNRFELVVLAAERARSISSGVPLTLARDNDKNSVIALREIAAKNISPNALREAHISGLQKTNQIDEVEDENVYAEGQENIVGPEDFSGNSTITDFASAEEDLDMDINFSDDVPDKDIDF